MINLNENLESLLTKIGNKLVSKPFVFAWNDNKNRPHIGHIIDSLEEDFKLFYKDRLNGEKYREFLAMPEFTGGELIYGVYFQGMIGRFLDDTLLNASTHGHGIKKNSKRRTRIKRQITIQIYYSRKGIIYSIKDPGNGFDVNEIVRKKRAREDYGQKYITPSGIEMPGGQGFWMFDQPARQGLNLIVSFNYNGNSPPVGNSRVSNENYGNNILLCHLFHPKLSKCF